MCDSGWGWRMKEKEPRMGDSRLWWMWILGLIGLVPDRTKQWVVGEKRVGQSSGPASRASSAHADMLSSLGANSLVASRMAFSSLAIANTTSAKPLKIT